MNKSPQINRRVFLRGAGGAVMALPLLESLATGCQTASASVPKRAVFLAMGYGVTKESWYPDPKDVGSRYKIPKGLRALEKHRENISIIQNLSHKHSREGHWGSTFWLTGANRFAIPGQSFHNSISVDQVIANAVGNQTRYASVRINGSGSTNEGHGQGSCLSWNHVGKAMPAHRTSLQLYHRLFSKSDLPLKESIKRLREQKSVLDAMVLDAKSVKRGLSKRDTEKLNEFFESIREIETRLAKEESWLDVPKKKPKQGVAQPRGELAGRKEMQVVVDLMVAAMEIDATRVFSYQMPVESLIKDLGAEISAHSMSHYNTAERKAISEKRDEFNAKLLARMMDKLATSKQLDGSSLLDHTAITMGTNLSHVHNLRNAPTIVAGGGAGFRQGQHIVMKDPRTPLCNLWLSILKGMGIKAQSHGDSHDVIKSLMG